MKPTSPAPITILCLAFGLLVILNLNTQTAQAQQVEVNAADPSVAKPINSPEITSQVNVHYDVVNGAEVWTVTPC